MTTQSGAGLAAGHGTPVVSASSGSGPGAGRKEEGWA